MAQHGKAIDPLNPVPCRMCGQPAKVSRLCDVCYLKGWRARFRERREMQLSGKLWDGQVEMDILRDACPKDFWTFFLYAFGAPVTPKGQRWIEHDIHYPLAQWFQKHVFEWRAGRKQALA